MSIRRHTSQRMFTVALIVVVHMCVVLLLLAYRDVVATRPPIATIEVRSISAPLNPPAVVPPEKNLEVSDLVAAPSFEVASPPASGAQSCDLTAALASSLGHDPITVSALDAVATDPRRAVMLWDGGWQGRAEADPLRRAVIAVLQTMPAQCLDEPQVGPRLVIVAFDSISVTIAIGSGTWTWRALESDSQAL